MKGSTEDLLAPPSEEVAQSVSSRFAHDVATHYGPRLVGLYLFGSRARGDHHADSDADIAVVLEEPFSYWGELRILTDFTYDYLDDDGVELQPHPLTVAQWKDPLQHANSFLVTAMRRDGKSLL